MLYKILFARNFQELERKVNEYIQNGWLPLGGIADTNSYCSQAVTIITKE